MADAKSSERAKPPKPKNLQTVVRWRYRDYPDVFGLDWNVFVEFHKNWNDVKEEKKGAKNVMRLLHSWMGGFTTRSMDLRDISSIEPSPEDFAE